MLRTGIDFTTVRETQAVVVGPTLELVMKIHHEACKLSYNTTINPVVVYDGIGYQRDQVEKGAHMIIGTPGWLLDFVRQQKASRSFISCIRLKLISYRKCGIYF